MTELTLSAYEIAEIRQIFENHPLAFSDEQERSAETLLSKLAPVVDLMACVDLQTWRFLCTETSGRTDARNHCDLTAPYGRRCIGTMNYVAAACLTAIPDGPSAFPANRATQHLPNTWCSGYRKAAGRKSGRQVIGMPG